MMIVNEHVFIITHFKLRRRRRMKHKWMVALFI